MPIDIRNLSFSYNRHTVLETAALKNVSLTVENGEFVGIMGRTGCGKSSLIQLIAGLLEPSTGTVFLDGEDIFQPAYDRTVLRRAVGLVFQYPETQLFESTVEKDVAYGLKYAGLGKEETEQRVRKALETVGFSFDQIRGKSPFGLSGGEKRRVAIAGILAIRPQYLLLDEPVAGLDPIARTQFLELLKKLNKEGVTILMISHNADAIAACCSRIVILEQGQIAADGTPAELFRDMERMRKLCVGVPQSRALAELLRERGMDIPAETVSYPALLDAVVRQKERRP